MELVLLFAFIAWLCWLCDRSDLVDAGKAAYAQYRVEFGYFDVECAARFERYLEQREGYLDREVDSLNQYLRDNPPPPKVTP